MVKKAVLCRIGGFTLYWYGLCAALGGWGSLWYLDHLLKTASPTIKKQCQNGIYWSGLGALIGGRIGYFALYNPLQFWQTPWIVWQVGSGGMSFHGGLLLGGIVLAGVAWKMKASFWLLSDLTVQILPITLGMGRIGNFINQELWGRPTTLPWGVVFKGVDLQPRHPSQLYEACLEGPLLGYLLWRTRTRTGSGLSALVFMLSYGLFRFIIEFFRDPDPQIGLLLFDFTLGQWLCLAMIPSSLILYYRYRGTDNETVFRASKKGP